MIMRPDSATLPGIAIGPDDVDRQGQVVAGLDSQSHAFLEYLLEGPAPAANRFLREGSPLLLVFGRECGFAYQCEEFPLQRAVVAFRALSEALDHLFGHILDRKTGHIGL
jgi:hypothetical protein